MDSKFVLIVPNMCLLFQSLQISQSMGGNSLCLRGINFAIFFSLGLISNIYIYIYSGKKGKVISYRLMETLGF